MSIFDDLNPRHQRAMSGAAEDARWEREQLERRLEAENKHATYLLAEEMFAKEHGCSRAEWEQHQAAVNEARYERDSRAEYGSPQRPAFLIDGAVMPPKQANPVARSASRWEAEAIADIERSRQLAAETGEWMRAEWDALVSRQRAQEDVWRRREYARQLDELGY
jgi:hypothetical protein